MQNKKWRYEQIGFIGCLVYMFLIHCNKQESIKTRLFDYSKQEEAIEEKVNHSDTTGLDTISYNNKLLQLSHYKPSRDWPVKTDYPLNGAILPFKRIVAYYGNLYSA